MINYKNYSDILIEVSIKVLKVYWIHKKYGVYESQGNYDSQIDYSTVSSIKLYNSEFIFLVSELNLTSVQLQALLDCVTTLGHGPNSHKIQ